MQEKLENIFLGFWHHIMPEDFYTFSLVNFDQFSIPPFPSSLTYYMNNPDPRHLSANKGNGYV